MAPAENGWVALARIVRPHGRRGEMSAELLTDDAGRFAGLQRVFLCAAGQPPQSFALRHAFPHQDRVVLALEGITDMAAARGWTGAEVCLPAAERMAPPPGRYFISELVGCAVWDHGRLLGRVAAVTELPGAAPLLAVTAGEREILIPFAASYLRVVDTAARRVEMDLPAGMAELNAPDAEQTD